MWKDYINKLKRLKSYRIKQRNQYKSQIITILNFVLQRKFIKNIIRKSKIQDTIRRFCKD